MTTATSRSAENLASEALTPIDETGGVRVVVVPVYIAAESDPEASRYVYGYRVRITNESATALRLVSRRWIVIDAEGERREIEGEGVVGQHPAIQPGGAHEYASFCPLKTAWGTMEGSYFMRAEIGATHEVRIGRFFLVAPDGA